MKNRHFSNRRKTPSIRSNSKRRLFGVVQSFDPKCGTALVIVDDPQGKGACYQITMEKGPCKVSPEKDGPRITGVQSSETTLCPTNTVVVEFIERAGVLCMNRWCHARDWLLVKKTKIPVSSASPKQSFPKRIFSLDVPSLPEMMARAFGELPFTPRWMHP
jgi:hypothetical protein